MVGFESDRSCCRVVCTIAGIMKEYMPSSNIGGSSGKGSSSSIGRVSDYITIVIIFATVLLHLNDSGIPVLRLSSRSPLGLRLW